MLAAMSTTALANPYLSLQAGIAGIGEYDHVFGNFSHTDDFNDQRTTGRIAAGYLAMLDNSNFSIGVESGLNGSLPFKSDNYYDVKLKRWSFDILGVVDFYATEKFDIFGKLGAAYVTNKVSSSYFYDSYTHRETVPKMGLGIGYDVTPCINMNLTLMHEFSEDGTIPSMTAALVGVKFNLP